MVYEENKHNSIIFFIYYQAISHDDMYIIHT